MRRIKTWCAGALCVLLALSALSAGAESGNADLLVRSADGSDGEFEYINSAVVVDDALYMLGNKLYRYRVGDEEPETLLTSEQIWNPPVASTINEKMEEPAAPEESSYMPHQLVGGDDALYALDTTHGMLGMWNGKRFDWIQQLDWADMARDQDGWMQTRSVQSPVVAEGWLYMLVMKNFDAWGEFTLRRYDLADGEFTALPTQDVQSFVPYAPGKLVALRRNMTEWLPSIVVVDAATGAVDRALYEADSYFGMLGGLACDTASGAVFVARGGSVVPVEGGALGEPLAYIPGDAREDMTAVILPSGHYAVSTYNGAFLRSLDPQYRPSAVLRLSGGHMDGPTADFVRANPDIAVQIAEGYMWSSQEIIDALVAKEDSVDVFEVSTQGGFRGLRDKGYLTDLSASEALAAPVEAMYPFVRDALLVNGKLYAYPKNMSMDLWRVNVDALEELGLGGMPGTMLDFMDVIERWIEEDMADAHPDQTLFDSPWFDREQLAYQLVMYYISRYERADEPLRFDTPVLREALERWERLPEFGDPPGPGRVVHFSSDQAAPLFSLYAMPFYRIYEGSGAEGGGPRLVPPPVFVAGEEPIVRCYLTLYAINPNSTQTDAALRYLEHIAENGEARDRYMLRPGLNEPVPEPYAQQHRLNLERTIADAQERLQEADEADRRALEEDIAQYQSWLQESERWYWMISLEAIEEYRALAPYFVLSTDSVMLNYDAGSVVELFDDLQRYAQGQMRLDEFLRELDKKAKMIFLEGQ